MTKSNNTPQRITIPFLKVLCYFLENPSHYHAGSDIYKNTNLQSGTVYPLLARMLNDNWLEVKWDEVPPESKRPPRHMYKLTGNGHRAAIDLMRAQFSPKIASCFERSK